MKDATIEKNLAELMGLQDEYKETISRTEKKKLTTKGRTIVKRLRTACCWSTIQSAWIDDQFWAEATDGIN